MTILGVGDGEGIYPSLSGLTGKEFHMKNWLLATSLSLVTLAVGVFPLAKPSTVAAQDPAPPVAVQKDGPFRLRAVAKADARQRRAQGFRADVTLEHGKWWVIFYP